MGFFGKLFGSPKDASSIVFLYDGRPFAFIPDPPFLIVATDYKAKCMEALAPLRAEIDSCGGRIVFDFLDYCKDVWVKCENMESELIDRVVAVIPKERPPLPMGTYAYAKRQAYNAQRRYQRRLK